MKPAFLVAEAGVNHNGDLRLAKEMIAAAKSSGADAVKFQTYSAEKLVAADAPKASYQLQNTLHNESQMEMLRRYELGFDDHVVLMEECRQQGIEFMSSPFDERSVDLLLSMGIQKIKIPSGELGNIPYLEKIAGTNKEIFLSTGMATLEEIEESVRILEEASIGKPLNLTILHCISAYPAPMNELNLLAIQKLRKRFPYEVGFSDHSLGFEAAISAVALGAVVIEKHFTLDKSFDGPDHKASLDVAQLHEFVCAIRKVESALGDGIKKVMPCEAENRLLVRKSIHVKELIKKGEIFTPQNLITQRPATGMSPFDWHKVMGRTASRNYSVGEIIPDEF